MTAEEKRNKVRDTYKTILGRNKYSQAKRDYCFAKYKDGYYYSDCSSSISYSYKVSGYSFGILNTVGMFGSSKLKKVAVKIVDGIPVDISKLRIGDMLLFAGNDSSRASSEYVGHVEMVYDIRGDKVTLCGHGSGTPSLKDMVTYCKRRQSTSASTKRGNRGLIKVVRFIQDDEAPTQPSGFFKVKTGTSWNVRTEPSKDSKQCRIVNDSNTIIYLGEMQDGWYKVSVDGFVGWISGRAGEPITGKAQKLVVNGHWYVRMAPNKDAKALGSVKSGTELVYQGEEKDGWYLVIYDNQNAWISKKSGKIE